MKIQQLNNFEKKHFLNYLHKVGQVCWIQKYELEKEQQWNGIWCIINEKKQIVNND